MSLGLPTPTAQLMLAGSKTFNSPAMNYLNKYRNPFAKDTLVKRPDFYENNAPKVREYRGVSIYKLFNEAYDFVIGGCCITQRAGITHCEREIDLLLSGETPVHDEVVTHLQSLGFPAKSYSDYHKEWIMAQAA